MDLQFSYSKLGAFADCPRCFWMVWHKDLVIPRGKAGSLPQGMDSHLKRRYDFYRGTLMKKPPELAGVSGTLYDNQAVIKKWRYWKTGLQTEVDGIKIIGALDDAWLNEDGTMNMLDYKTRASAPKDGYAAQYYGRQADFYDLLLRANDIKASTFGMFVFYHPENEHISYGAIPAQDVGILVPFTITIQHVEADRDRCIQLIRDAAACLRGPLPANKPECEYCKLVEGYKHA